MKVGFDGAIPTCRFKQLKGIETEIDVHVFERKFIHKFYG